MKQIAASEFKARCLGLIDEVGVTGSRITITKRGRPVAQLIQYISGDDRYPQEALIGSAEVAGDIEGPVMTPDEWSAVSGDQP